MKDEQLLKEIMNIIKPLFWDAGGYNEEENHCDGYADKLLELFKKYANKSDKLEAFSPIHTHPAGSQCAECTK